MTHTRVKIPCAPSTSVLGLVLAVAASGCNSTASDLPDSGLYLAFANSFLGFHDWPSAPAIPAPSLPVPAGFVGGTDGGNDAGIHNMGPMTVFWNRAPPSGSSTFPTGTIIAKETNGGDLTSRQIFAMVKRGNNYDPGGAVNWEWFELQNEPDGTEGIIWRGAGPPTGEQYGGDPNACNGCHLLAAANDDVWASALLLTNF